MHGDPELGAVLRGLRTARRLTLAAVARRVGCAESLLSLVETGGRQLQPWLAECLDAVYGTSGAVVALLDGYASGSQNPRSARRGDVLLVRVPGKSLTVPVSRRELLAALGIGALGTMLGPVERAVDGIAPTRTMLDGLERTLAGFNAVGRTAPPIRLVDALTAHVAIIDALRRRSTGELRRDFSILQARYGESLSWMYEEASDLHSALYWTDRASHWAQAVNWTPMVAYAFVRRSMMAISFTSDGLQAVENARVASEMPGTPPRIRGLAAKQMSFGYALAGRADDSARALDTAMELLGRPQRDDGPTLGQRSVVDDDLFAIFRTTCDIYLGRGESPIDVLEPRLKGIAKGSKRTHTITLAKLGRAYANVGQPHEASRLMLEAVEAANAVGSLSARSELRRILPLLAKWSQRSDVQEVRRLLLPPR
jgi:Helix-turn-helix domain